MLPVCTAKPTSLPTLTSSGARNVYSQVQEELNCEPDTGQCNPAIAEEKSLLGFRTACTIPANRPDLTDLFFQIQAAARVKKMPLSRQQSKSDTTGSVSYKAKPIYIKVTWRCPTPKLKRLNSWMKCYKPCKRVQQELDNGNSVISG